jgi:hypothetical protein
MAEGQEGQPFEPNKVLYDGREVSNPFIPSEEGMKKTISEISSQGLLIVGSLGRAAIYNKLLGDPMYEFHARGQDVLMAPVIESSSRLRPRDVDVVGGEYTGPLSDYFPHTPDTKATRMITKEQDGRWVFTYKSGEQVSLDPSLFQPVEAETIFQTPCLTVRPATHIALLTSRSPRPKDIQAKELLEGVLPEEDRQLLTTDLYKGFESMLLRY